MKLCINKFKYHHIITDKMQEHDITNNNGIGKLQVGIFYEGGGGGIFPENVIKHRH